MQKITPFLWFDDNAEEAVNVYVSLFKKSKITGTTRYDEASAKVSGRKAGSVMTVGFELAGQNFAAINGGPVFTFTPATSFFIRCDSRKEIDSLWNGLVKDGAILMELDKYPFSERYGWLQDRFGVSWQLFLDKNRTGAQKIVPCLMFVGKQVGNAEKAMTFYTSLFKDSSITMIARYEKDEGDIEGTIKHATFRLSGEEFIVMDSNRMHKFGFTSALSFVIDCGTQAEVDHFWNALLKGGQAQQCGWLTDKYGVTWQVVPTILPKLLGDKDPKKAKRVMEAMLKMVKLDIATLQKAYDNA